MDFTLYKAGLCSCVDFFPNILAFKFSANFTVLGIFHVRCELINLGAFLCEELVKNSWL